MVATDPNIGEKGGSGNDPINVLGVETRHFPVDRWSRHFPHPLIQRFLFCSELTRYLRRNVKYFDVVHIHFIYAFPSLSAALISKRQEVPYVLTLHGNLDPYMQRKNRLVKDIYLNLYGRRALNAAAALHLVSEGERQMLRTFKISAPNVVIGFGLNVEKFQRQSRGRFRAQRPELANKRIIMSLSRLSYTKGLDLLVEAFRDVAGAHPDVHLLIVGPDDGFERHLRLMIRWYALADRVTLTGRVDEEEKISALHDADVFVLPSYSEAFGLAMIEAMACGLPVLLTDQAALARELEEQGAALVVRSDIQELASGLRLLVNDEKLRRRIGAVGIRLVADRFSWNTSTTQFVQLYENVARNGGQAHHR